MEVLDTVLYAAVGVHLLLPVMVPESAGARSARKQRRGRDTGRQRRRSHRAGATAAEDTHQQPARTKVASVPSLGRAPAAPSPPAGGGREGRSTQPRQAPHAGVEAVKRLDARGRSPVRSPGSHGSRSRSRSLAFGSATVMAYPRQKRPLVKYLVKTLGALAAYVESGKARARLEAKYVLASPCP